MALSYSVVFIAAMNYGIGNKSLSSKISLSEVEIEAFRTQFFLTYPRLQIFFREVVECCRKQVTTRNVVNDRQNSQNF